MSVAARTPAVSGPDAGSFVGLLLETEDERDDVTTAMARELELELDELILTALLDAEDDEPVMATMPVPLCEANKEAT